MHYQIKRVSKDDLNDYATIPIQTQVSSEYQVKPIKNGLGGLQLEEVQVEPYLYDIGAEPHKWLEKFDVRNWGFYIVYDGDKPIAAMTLVYKTKEINMLSGRTDLVVLWDLRVSHAYKSKKIGTALFKEAIKWSEERHCKQIKIETQTINIPACQFYAKMGCHLGEINQYAYYPDLHETMLIWYYNL